MDTHVVFNYDEWDNIADISTIHLSYLVQCLLPLRLIEWNKTRRHYDGVVADVNNKTSTGSEFDDVDFVVTGSTAEGFAIPNCLSKNKPPHVIRFADVDMLVVIKSLPVSTVELPCPNTTEFKAYFDSKGIQPGYTRLCLPSFKHKDSAFIFDEETNKHYLSGVVLKERLLALKLDLEPSETAHIQGPALSVDNSQLLTIDNWGNFNAGSSKDFVAALPCNPWPKEVSDWSRRALKSEWLSEEIIQTIVDGGCHVVAVPSKNSLRPELEWRMSFSASEGRLAREAVTDYQRQCYIYIKILRYQIMKPVSVLSSYVFKSVFLYSCEKLPVDKWKTNPGNCILYMLDVILECLSKKFVPTYFLPENNLIAHLSDEELITAIRAVEKIRSDPIGPVIDFTDDKVVGLNSVLVPFRKLVDPLLKDINKFKEHRNKAATIMRGILPTTINFCQALLFEDKVMKHQEAIRILIDLYKVWLLQTDYKASLIQFVDEYGLTIKDPTRKIRFYEAVIRLFDEYPEFNLARGNLACTYHACAYTADSLLNQETQTRLLMKAEELFEQVYNENKGSGIDYVTYLLKRKKFQKATEILEELLENKVDSMFLYNKNEAQTLEEPIKSHVLEHGEITSDAVSFAYFYLVKCKCAMENVAPQDIVSLLKKFEHHCEMKTGESSIILLKYAKSVAEDVIKKE